MCLLFLPLLCAQQKNTKTTDPFLHPSSYLLPPHVSFIDLYFEREGWEGPEVCPTAKKAPRRKGPHFPLQVGSLGGSAASNPSYGLLPRLPADLYGF